MLTKDDIDIFADILEFVYFFNYIDKIVEQHKQTQKFSATATRSQQPKPHRHTAQTKNTTDIKIQTKIEKNSTMSSTKNKF